MTKDDIEKLADWTKAKEVQTKLGPRLLRKADVTDRFSAAWREHKPEIKALGAGFSKNLQGEWELSWWMEIDAEEKANRARAIEESRATDADIDLPCPDGLAYRPFQKAGIRYGLSHPSVLIGDDMGLGKTIQAIGIINSDPTIKTAIVVCPKSLKLNWYREMKKWLTRNFTIEIANGHLPHSDIVIVNYEGLIRIGIEAIKQRNFDISIVDEAHYIKNAKAQRSKAVKAIQARRKVRMTGTPICNRPAELYNLIEDMPKIGFWGTSFQFARRYCGMTSSIVRVWDEKLHRTVEKTVWNSDGASNLDELQRRLREACMVRRLKSEVLTELPAKVRQIVEIEADDPDQRKAVKREQSYERDSEERLAALRAEAELAKAEGQESYEAAVKRLTDASQVDFTEMSRLRHETALAKVPAVIEHVMQALDDNDNKIFLAAHHHDVIDQICMGLAEFHPVKLTGEMNEKDRQSSVDHFQNEPKVRVLVGSIMAAGVGITLTASSHVVFAELDWVPGNVTQCEDRCHRIGQTQSVLVQHIVLADSLDARMAKMLVEKQEVIDNALDVRHPDRAKPVYQPKAAASTASESVKEIEKAAAELTPLEVADIHRKLRILAGMDGDFAAELNGVGFNKIDARIGHDLAEREWLTPKQAILGKKICAKYHAQFGE